MGCCCCKKSEKQHQGREFPDWYSFTALANNDQSAPPYIRAMTNFTKHKLNGDSWYSPPFYTGPSGYKLQLKVDAAGSSAAKRSSHMSVAVCLMKGDNDDRLDWPFKGSVDIKLLNWIEDENHLKHTFTASSATEPTHSVNDGAVGSSPGVLYTQTEFASHKQLVEHSSSNKTQYLMGDVLCFVITAVTLISGIKCTYDLNGKVALHQGWFQCYTCWGGESQFGCCEVCANECHKGHQLINKGMAAGAVCDCGNNKHKSAVCTFHVTGYQHVMQPLYSCQQCFKSTTVNEVCCYQCMKVCHAGHQVVDHRLTYMMGFCDCSLSESKCCKISKP